jgi:septation ring formation regulator
MKMEIALLLLISMSVVTIILIIVVLFLLQSHKNKSIKKQLQKLEVEKNELDSSPVIPELSKIESYNKNEKLESMYNNWTARLNNIREEQVPKINDMLLEADYSLQKQDYKSTLYKIARLEMEIYKVRTNSEFLLKEIKEITSSEERNRALVTTLKSKYRELYQKFTKQKGEYGEICDVIELQFENIARRFEDFEKIMDQNEYTEVATIIKSIDEMLKHMEIVLEEIPSICLLTTSILPKKIEEALLQYEEMVKEGYPLDYLNVEHNIEEAQNKIVDIQERSKVLNLEHSLDELKILLTYFENLFTDFEKEKLNRKNYEEASKIFEQKIKKIGNIVREIMNQIDEIQSLYNLSNEDVIELKNIEKDLISLNSDYEVFMQHTGNNTFAYSKLIKELEELTNRLATLEERVDNILNSIGSMKEDEIRARQQLEEIKSILKESKHKIREYDLPVIPKTYFVELNDAQAAIKEIVKELEKKPITISVLNTRVDTARDLVLKLHGTTKEMMRTAMFAEMAIVYGNRFRSEVDDLNKHLNYAEKLFFAGEYKKSLEISINSLNKVEKGIYDKLLSLYATEK